MLSDQELVQSMLAGSRPALSRILSRIENGTGINNTILHLLASRLGKAIRIGFTGPPGAGKSTLVSAYARHLRARNQTVAVLAVDPTSPFSGGALLGDRVRMTSIATDEGVFVRSLATRGDLGGMAKAAADMADVFDAVGFDVILLETVGVGQSELEVAQHADCTVVVLVPESGDSIQGMKAGLMEIADIFIVNKSDRDGADRFAAELGMAMHLKDWGDWTPPVVSAVAVRGEGIEEFDAQVQRFMEHLHASGKLLQHRAARLRRRCQRLIDDSVINTFWTDEKRNRLEEAIRQNKSVYEISRELLK